MAAVPRSLLTKLNPLVIIKHRSYSGLTKYTRRLELASLLQCSEGLSSRPYQRSVHTSTSSKGTSYEPDGKTTVTILNSASKAPLMIDSYNKHGFKLNNGMSVFGPVAIFPKTILGWDVAGVQDITPPSLALFACLEPKPDILVIGVGDYGAKLPLETVQFLRKQKINMEILSTEHACTTFNFLSAEGRCAAAVMVPPTRIVWTGQDLWNSKIRRKELEKDDDDEAPGDTSKKE